MKKSNIMLTGAAVLVALTAVVGMSLSAFAHGNSPDVAFFSRRMNLSDKQRTETHDAMRAKMDEMGIDTSDWKTGWANRRANREAVQAALNAGNYDDFAAAIGDNSPLKGKINEDNFGRLVEARNLMESGRKIMEELGIERHTGRFGKGCKGAWN